MAGGGPAPIPETLLLDIDEERVRSGDPEDLLKVLKELVKALKAMYMDMADAINLSPEYQAAGAAPAPAEGRFQVFNDGAGGLWLAYNDGGAVKKVQFDPPADPDLYVTLRLAYTWAIPNLVAVASGDVNYVVPFYVSLPTGQTAKLVMAKHRVNAGTSATCKLTKNGSDVTGFTGISVTTSSGSTDPTDVDLADGDLLALVVTAISGAPKNLTFTIFIEFKVKAVAA